MYGALRPIKRQPSGASDFLQPAHYQHFEMATAHGSAHSRHVFAYFIAWKSISKTDVRSSDALHAPENEKKGLVVKYFWTGDRKSEGFAS